MEDQAETREQFLREVEKLRRQVANLQAKDPEPDNAGEPRLSLEDAQRFFDALPDIILMVDAQGDILRANRTSMEALGYKEENVLGKSMELFFPPERREEAWLALAETVSDKPTVADISLLKKNGRLISTETKVIKSFWDGRDVFFGICRDISSRRLAEKILRNQRDLGLALTSARSLDETTRLCAEYSVRMPNIDAWGIFLLDEASGDMILDNPLGFSSGFVNSESRQAAGSDFTRLAMAGREVYAACKQTDVPLCGIFHNEGFTSMGVLPFKPEGRVIACAVFASRTLTGFTDEIRGRINAIAPQIGLAISWAKGLEKMRISEYAMESSINAMVMTDLDWVITYVNRALLDLMQMEKEDMLGKHFFDLWVSPAAFDEYLEIFTKTGNWRGELDAKKKDGSTFSVQMSGFVIKDEAGKPVRFMGSFVDITEYKTAEKALRESEQKYRILVETVTDTVFVIDTDGKLTYLNSAFEKGTGFSIQEKLGCHFTDLLSPEYVEKAISDFRRGLLGEKVPNYEVEILRRDGGVVSAEISVTSMLDPEGNPMCRIGVARDITDRKRAEEALKE
ncbi:MAG: PAS domain S-box protein, partial [Thermodesulfobacteriota bacterium]|nr:PAS domain S-box protein [Thermodesulfobacteriota bacterium]